MRIAFIDTLGLTYDGSTLTKRGLGGSESAIINLSQRLANLGHQVFVYNDCSSDDSVPGLYNNVHYKPLKAVEEINCEIDVAIASRSVAPFTPDEQKQKFKSFVDLPDFSRLQRHANHKVLWLHDTFCDGDNLIEFLINFGHIDEIYTLSDWHTSYIMNCDHSYKRDPAILKSKVWETRNGINVTPTEWIHVGSKDPDHFVYNASATKGMVPLIEKIWPQIRHHNSRAHLTVIGGYYKFRNNSLPDDQQQEVERLKNLNVEGVTFTGVITQEEISKILSNATYFLYPSAFPETYGISTLEALAHNCAIITCQRGALEEVAIDAASWKLPYPVEADWSNANWLNEQEQIDKFVSMTLAAYDNKYLTAQKCHAGSVVRNICGWDSVAKQWNFHLHQVTGRYLLPYDIREVQKIERDVARIFKRRFTDPVWHGANSANSDKKLGIVVTAKNGQRYVKRCLQSIANQLYDNYTVFFVDDNSSDQTYETARNVVEEFDYTTEQKFRLCKNTSSCGALANQIHVIADNKWEFDYWLIIDGDDALVNDPFIFDRYIEYFAKYDLIYGSCWSEADRIPLIAQEYPPEIIQSNTFRNHLFPWNIPYTHMRGFSTQLFDKIELTALIDESGNYYKAAGDLALMYQLLENVDRYRIFANPEVVYLYNDTNPNNDYKINSEEQDRNAARILGKPVVKPEQEIQTVNNGSDKTILIAIPTAQNIHPDTFKSIYDLEIPEGYKATFQYFYGYRVDQVRNLISDWVVRGFDYLFAVDYDISFAPDTLKRLIEADKDIVTGIYRVRNNQCDLEIYDMFQQRIPLENVPSNLFEIGGCGFGGVLVKKTVLETVGYPQFEYHPALDHSNTFSEDNDFCKKARDRGFTIWCDPSLRYIHHGMTTFEIPQNNEHSISNRVVDALRDNRTIDKRFEELRDQDLIPQTHQNVIRDLASIVRPKVIYDIGSCVLHWHDFAQKLWPEADIYCTDAMSDLKRFYKNSLPEPYWSVGEALWSESGLEIDWNENVEHPGGNSVFEENRKYSPQADVLFPREKRTKKKTITLDDLRVREGWPFPDMIKMDIQGSEMAALLGGSETLKHTKWLIVECQHKEYNIGAAMVDEIKAYMISMGWEFVQEFGGNTLDVDKDYLFLNKNKR